MKKEITTSQMIKLLYKILPKKKYFICGILFLLGLSIIEIGSSYLIQLLGNSAIDKSMENFLVALYLLIFITILDILFMYLRTRLLGVYTESGVTYLRDKLAKKYNNLDMENFSTQHTGDYVSRATNDMNKVRNFLSTTFPNLIWTPVTGIGALIYLFFISWRLTLISFAIFPVVVILVSLISKPLSSISKKLQEKLGVANTLIQDHIKGVEVTKAYNLEGILGENFNHVVDESVYYGKKIAGRRAIIMTISEVFSIIPFFITFFLGGYYVISGNLSVGALLAFINLINYVANFIGQFPKLLTTAKVDLAGCRRIFEVLDYPEERTNGENFPLSLNQSMIEFKNVNFSYPNTSDSVLNYINFTIKQGESVAIVGPSGGGKSTIIRLLLGYYHHYEGEVYVNGHELKTWNLSQLRENLALVSQDTYLFPETIQENISYGNPIFESSIEEIKNASKIANADEFIMSFQNQYRTTIGELGNRLSGGQKQRIAIARAVLKDAEILLLDEATSSLDNESESIVQDSLNHMMIGKTTVVIAHRLSTIRNVDRILVIDCGGIVEEGSHDELLLKNGLYKDLYQKQMKIEAQDGMVAS